MSYYYNSYGASLSDQGYSPDDIEYIWICSECQVEEWTTAPLHRGWETVRTGERGDDVAFLCDRCAGRL